MKKFFTSESVTEGHPDKICDLISDSILDEILTHDPSARVACESCVTTGFVLVMGEITTECYADIEGIVRETVANIGYNNADIGFDAKTCSVLTTIHKQSPDIEIGVKTPSKIYTKKSDEYDSVGAGDQGMMFGYACDETEELMPLPIVLAHALTKQLTLVRKDRTIEYLRPDGKSQVTVEYDGEKPVRVDTVVVSAQHASGVSHSQIERDIIENVIKKAIPENLLDKHTRYFVNPTGNFVVGGPQGDSGLTGRKIIVDTYGGYCPHGGGAFSGKDPTKVDRSASYMARYICKNIVAAGLSTRCELQVSYAIGVARPTSLYVNTFNTGIIPDAELKTIIEKVFDLRPKAIIEHFDLTKPIYRQTTNYGHFGKKGLPWEKTDKVKELKEYAAKLKRGIASFEVDHNKLQPGFYLSRTDGDAVTYDLRMVEPKSGKYIDTAVLHTIEHQIACFIRNNAFSDKIIYFGPMGCRTGCYLVCRLNYADAKQLIKKACKFVAESKVVAGATERECGNYKEHDLEGAKAVCKEYAKIISGKNFEY